MPAPSILQYTERVAGQIAQQHQGNPMQELRLWLRLAHQRESMVSELYAASKVEKRLGSEPDQSTAGVIRSAMLSIWAHETSHTQFLGSIRSTSSDTAALAHFQGVAEGWITRAATEGNALARLLIAVGSSLGQVPAFAREIDAMNLHELLCFHAELEATARMGYERIVQLLGQLPPTSGLDAEVGPTFRFDIVKILCEEQFHEAAFSLMADWPLNLSTSADDIASKRASALHDLCREKLSVGAVQQAIHNAAAGQESTWWPSRDPKRTTDSVLVSDGGLTQLFERFDLETPVA